MFNIPDPRTSNKRLLLLLAFFTFLFFAVAARLFYLQVIKYDFFRTRSIDQRTRIIILASDRGDILDREGNVLATSIDTCSVFAVPREIKDKAAVADALSKFIPRNKYLILNDLYNNKHFVWIERQMPRSLGEKIRNLPLAGVGVLLEKKRIYPGGSLASQLIGFTGIDNLGLSGIELGLDKYLRGNEGKLMTESDPGGRELVSAVPREIEAPTDGMAVTLSIDGSIQYFAQRELARAVREHGARSGSIIVMDVNDGDILAIASKPDFNPNRYGEYPSDNWELRPVLDVYEPGSTFKVITVACGLERGIIGMNDRIECPDSLKVGGRTIENSHKLKPEDRNATLHEILAQSINTGAAKIGMKIGEQNLYDFIKRFGFGERTRVGIPGETPGIFRNVKNWSRSDIATISFGQGIAVTALQLIVAVSSIANGGMRIKPALVKKIESLDGSFVKIFPKEEQGRVVSEKTSKEMLELMIYVVDKGTGSFAKIKDFKIAGKTGTAQKVKPGGPGYWPGHYVASFIGVAPATDPKIAVLVIIDEPKGVPWGEKVAAPHFARVMEDTLRYLNIAPDDLKTQNSKLKAQK